MEQLLQQVDVLSHAIVQPNAPVLTDEETKVAAEDLCLPMYRQVVRAKDDPRLAKQEVGLFSFTPSPGATPDKYGIYGVAKLRGNYPTANKAAAAARMLIRQVDSANKILHVRVGQTFPVTTETKWTEQFQTVDLDKEVDGIEDQQKREAEEKEEKERKILLEREKKLLEENREILEGKFKEDPLDTYIRLNTARAQLKWTRADLERKIDQEITPAIEKRNKEIAEMDEQYPEFRKQFLQKYLDARTEACLSNDIPVDHEKVQQGFLKYLVEDLA